MLLSLLSTPFSAQDVVHYRPQVPVTERKNVVTDSLGTSITTSTPLKAIPYAASKNVLRLQETYKMGRHKKHQPM